MYRNMLHFYTLTTNYQKEIKETIPFTIASKRIKYLGINLPMETKDPYSKNYKTLMKQIYRFKNSIIKIYYYVVFFLIWGED